MKEFEIKISVKAYSTLNELPADEKKLIQAAQKALADAYAPYSGFRVGAAVLLANDEILTGSNQENASFPAGICAEGTVFSVASSLYSNVAISKLAVTVKSEHKLVSTPVAPCGICRQRIAEYEMRFNSNIEILMMGEEGEVYKAYSVKDLLPLTFSNENL